MFNQMFQNPYLQFLPPEAQQMLQQRQMFDMGTAMLQNSVGQKRGLAAFGDAMAQYKQGQMADATQMTEMQKLAEAMRLAQEKNQREAGAYRGEDWASQQRKREFDREDATRRYGYDQGLEAARIRAQHGGMFPFGFDPNAPVAAPSAAEQSRMDFERARAAGGGQDKAPPGGGGKVVEKAPDPAKKMALEQEMSFVPQMSLQELDDLEDRYGDMLEYRHRAVISAARMNKEGRRTRLPDVPEAWNRPGGDTGGGF